ncbi:MAG: rhomboid family intramembrane serine protease [Pseudomonadales bacterium]|jgi:membrane associated rhomboid family serine protease|nr:rhomboid family intramembrane serine protease [Pseudomonadales bacterium]MDP6471151.1 rhomboid family intramembrane serine protease [Pseudomonadales bacterium]MDP6825662.1 rhomboid family intramembrane serine protease [Pseudomonadales bacterium]MDP6971631.1 rhomboid family intramembrane serine protease [Pseudomonadales bacterium]|tara:strand:+ start:65 stop:982 length:918 start_codon:yes stop_codon:yes gene_type:complete
MLWGNLREIEAHVTLDPELWRCIQQSHERWRLREAGLVLSSVEIEHRVEEVGGIWGLWVRLEDEPRARLQLEKFVAENRQKPRSRHPVPVDIDTGLRGVLGYLGVIWLLPLLQGVFVSVDWYGQGAMVAVRVMEGEWWRTITALTLHGDLTHIVSNSVFGAVFGLFVGRHLGSGFGWLMVLLTGAAGNWVNAALQPDQFASVGASTATFAALGLVAAFIWRRGYLRARDWQRSFAPVFAAIALLAFTGTGGENTDVAAHFAGFVAGLGAGLIVARLELSRLGKSGQVLSGVLALGLVVWAWSAAV